MEAALHDKAPELGPGYEDVWVSRDTDKGESGPDGCNLAAQEHALRTTPIARQIEARGSLVEREVLRGGLAPDGPGFREPAIHEQHPAERCDERRTSCAV